MFISITFIGDDGMNSPPALALAERGIVENVRGFMVYGDYRNDHPISEIVHAVSTGEVDVAAVWGRSRATLRARKSRGLS
jgi:mxaJ protein